MIVSGGSLHSPQHHDLFEVEFRPDDCSAVLILRAEYQMHEEMHGSTYWTQFFPPPQSQPILTIVGLFPSFSTIYFPPIFSPFCLLIFLHDALFSSLPASHRWANFSRAKDMYIEGCAVPFAISREVWVFSSPIQWLSAINFSQCPSYTLPSKAWNRPSYIRKNKS